MNISFPFEGETAASLFSANERGTGGFYPVGVNNFWHGGIHLSKDKPVRAITDGVLLAYRMDQELKKCKIGNQELNYSTSFVLLRHELKTSDGFNLIVYSLSMHLLPLSKYSDAQKKKAPAFFPRKYTTNKGLTHRKEPVKKPGNDLGIFPKDTVLNFKNAANLREGWQELAEGGYVYFSDTLVSTSIVAPEYDKVINLSSPTAIRQDEILGYPGPYMDTEKVVHFEIFTDSITFMDNPWGIKRGPKTLKIPRGTSFKSKEPDVDKLIVNLTAGSRLKFVEQDNSSDARKVSCVDIVGWVKHGDLGPYDQRRNSYPLLRDISSMNVKVPSSNTDAPPQVSVAAKKNDLVRYVEKNGDYRRIGVSFKEIKEGWAHKNDLGKFSANQYTLANPLNELLTQNPTIAFKFERVVGQNAKELLPKEWRARAAALKTHKHETWYELEYEPGKKGWIKSDDPKMIALSDYDWPGWNRVQESGQYSKDGFCDVEGLIKLIDKEEKTGPQRNAPKAKDGKLTLAEIKAAYLDPSIGPMLRKLACLHPTEWDADTDQSVDKWKRLKERPWNMSDQSYQDTLKYIKALQWWSDVDKRNMPANASKIWHVHPISFIEILNNLTIPFTTKDKELIMGFVSGREGGYDSCNEDGEFAGLFDSVSYAGVVHIGLSWGFIQFSQDSGSLGKVLERMKVKNQTLFADTFGNNWNELLEVTQKDGDSGQDQWAAAGRPQAGPGVDEIRGPRVQKVAIETKSDGTKGELQDLWEGSWLSRFKTAGKLKDFQDAQVEIADEEYLIPALRVCKKMGIRSAKGIAFAFDRVVNEGSAWRLTRPWNKEPFHSFDEERRFLERVRDNAVSNDDIHSRLTRILDSQELRETSYDIDAA